MPLLTGGKKKKYKYVLWCSVLLPNGGFLQRMHHKTVLVFINKCGVLYNDLVYCSMIKKNESDKKSDVLDIFRKKISGFLYEGKVYKYSFADAAVITKSTAQWCGIKKYNYYVSCTILSWAGYHYIGASNAVCR
jgi:hypothetical protein